jgi:hypothetical protein
MEDVRAVGVRRCCVLLILSYPIPQPLNPLCSPLCRQTRRDARGRQVPQITRVQGTCRRGWARPSYPTYRLAEQCQHADERIRGPSLCIETSWKSLSNVTGGEGCSSKAENSMVDRQTAFSISFACKTVHVTRASVAAKSPNRKRAIKKRNSCQSHPILQTGRGGRSLLSASPFVVWSLSAPRQRRI